MPTYDFQCGQCGGLFEQRMTMAESDKISRVRCPSCGAASTRRVFSGRVNILTSYASPAVCDDQKPSASGGGCGCGAGSCGCGH